jgi:hypothetical protein
VRRGRLPAFREAVGRLDDNVPHSVVWNEQASAGVTTTNVSELDAIRAVAFATKGDPLDVTSSTGKSARS